MHNLSNKRVMCCRWGRYNKKAAEFPIHIDHAGRGTSNLVHGDGS